MHCKQHCSGICYSVRRVMWLFKQIHLMLGSTCVLQASKIRARGDYQVAPAGDLHNRHPVQLARDAQVTSCRLGGASTAPRAWQDKRGSQNGTERAESCGVLESKGLKPKQNSFPTLSLRLRGYSALANHFMQP